MRNLKYILFILLAGICTDSSAQIAFFKGSLAEALKKAKTEGKSVFVDFYTDWCEPCKLMVKEVFVDPEVGAYFNRTFVSCQLNAELPENKGLLQKYGVTAFPMMVFITPEGKELKKIRGAVPAERLLQDAKVAVGDELSFEQLYEKYKKNKKDTEAMQQILMEAPMFIQTQQGYELDKWSARVEGVFSDYLKSKKFTDMINPPDFLILTLFHVQTGKTDPIFDFLVENFDRYAVVVGKEVISDYLIGLNNAWIIQLCKKGNLEYKEQLKRLDGDLKKAYSGMTFGTLSVRDAVTYLADASYDLYRNNDAGFFEKMDLYFAGLGDSVNVNDYTQSLEDLYTVHQGKLPVVAQVKCIEWIDKALKGSMSPSVRTRLLIMLGECYEGTNDRTKAKQSLNQAFIVSAQIENKNMMKQLQQAIQSKLQGL